VNDRPKTTIKLSKKRRRITNAIYTLNHGIQYRNKLHTCPRQSANQHLYDQLITITIRVTKSHDIMSPA